MIDKILDILQRIKEIFVFDIKCNSLVFILIIVKYKTSRVVKRAFC